MTVTQPAAQLVPRERVAEMFLAGMQRRRIAGLVRSQDVLREFFQRPGTCCGGRRRFDGAIDPSRAATSAIPRFSAQSMAVFPSRLRIAGSAPAARSISTISIALPPSSGSHQSGVMPSFATCRASSGSAASTCRSRSTYPQNARLKTSRLYLTQKIEHPAIVEMGGPSERCVVVGELTRVDFGPAIDEHSRRFESASTGRMVQRARLSPILDFDWHTGIEEKRDDVGRSRMLRAIIAFGLVRSSGCASK